MGIYKSWNQVGERLIRTTSAGPLVPPSVATASVERLRRASEWARPRVLDLAGLPDLTEADFDGNILVVDRHGLLRGITQSLESNDLAPESISDSAQIRRPIPGVVALGGALAIRSLSRTVQSFRNIAADNTQTLLVAPNIWQVGQQLSLDQNDYARWVALRAGIWQLYFQRAAWLPAYERQLIDYLPRSVGEISRSLMLMSELVNTRMLEVMPRDISSVHWIRRHLPRSGLVETIEQLRYLRAPVPDVPGLRHRIQNFVAETGIASDPPRLELLLSCSDALPTDNEIFYPQEWVKRVNAI